MPGIEMSSRRVPGATRGATASASSAVAASATDDHVVGGDGTRDGRADERVIVDHHHADRRYACSAATSLADRENGAVRVINVPASGLDSIPSLPSMRAALSLMDERP